NPSTNLFSPTATPYIFQSLHLYFHLFQSQTYYPTYSLFQHTHHISHISHSQLFLPSHPPLRPFCKTDGHGRQPRADESPQRHFAAFHVGRSRQRGGEMGLT